MKRFVFFVALPLILVVLSIAILPTQAAENKATDQVLGDWTCWDDGTIDPCHTTLNSVSMTSITDGWAVGENGIIFRWNGDIWSESVSPTANRLNAVQMNTENDGWAVGNGGTILHWDGNTWSTVYSPASYDLLSISIVSPSNVWTVGWSIYHWNGSIWSQVSTPNNNSRAIAMVPGTNGSKGWAVGYNGSILQWNGSQWQVFSSPTTAYLMDVTMISDTDGWIVGDKGTVLHWDGVSWSIADFPGNTFASIWEIDAASSDDVWALGFDNGSYNIYHWDGANWIFFDGNGKNISYLGIAVTPNTNGTDAWVVGGSAYMLHWNNTEWIPTNMPYTNNFYGVNMISPTDGWIGGSGFPITRGDVFHWNGANWILSQDWIDILGMDFFTDGDGTIGWAGGPFGDIFLWDGASWTSVSSPTQIDLTSVDIISREDAWAVGNGPDPDHGYDTRGVIVHYVNNEWITVTLPTTTTMLVDVSMLSPTSGWAVGDNGTILEWQGSEWQTRISPTVQDLTAIDMVGALNGWIVGGNGTILHWDGITWSNNSSPTPANLKDVKFISQADGWAVGIGGTILHWDGAGWTSVNSPTKQTINAIAYASPYELWAVGWNGSILHYEYKPILTINFSTGAPGSYFTLTGTQFPPEVSVNLIINGFSLGSVQSDTTGSFNFILSTSLADEGLYHVTASVNPSATVSFILDNDSLVREQVGDYQIFDIPSGLTITNVIHLPLIKK